MREGERKNIFPVTSQLRSPPQGSKGRTIRKVMGGGGGGEGGGRGIFSLHDFFFSPTACAGIFFAGESLCMNFFSDKDCFVCHFLILKELFYKRIVVLCWF